MDSFDDNFNSHQLSEGDEIIFPEEPDEDPTCMIHDISYDDDGNVIATQGLCVPHPYIVQASKQFQGRYFFFNVETKKCVWSLHPSVIWAEEGDEESASQPTVQSPQEQPHRRKSRGVNNYQDSYDDHFEVSCTTPVGGAMGDFSLVTSNSESSDFSSELSSGGKADTDAAVEEDGPSTSSQRSRKSRGVNKYQDSHDDHFEVSCPTPVGGAMGDFSLVTSNSESDLSEKGGGGGGFGYDSNHTFDENHSESQDSPRNSKTRSTSVSFGGESVLAKDAVSDDESPPSLEHFPSIMLWTSRDKHPNRTSSREGSSHRRRASVTFGENIVVEKVSPSLSEEDRSPSLSLDHLPSISLWTPKKNKSYELQINVDKMQHGSSSQSSPSGRNSFDSSRGALNRNGSMSTAYISASDSDSSEPESAKKRAIARRKTWTASTENQNALDKAVKKQGIFTVLGGIGEGGSAVVVQVRHNKTNSTYAMKVIPKAKRTSNSYHQQQLIDELRCMTDLHPSPFLLQSSFAFESPHVIFFVMDYISGGDLFYHLSQRVSLNMVFLESETRALMAELYLALEHFHAHGFIHRDIKIENIMLTAQGHVKLVDYGLSLEVRNRDETDETGGVGGGKSSSSSGGSFSETKMEPAGSVIYMAPELIRDKTGGRHTDWWAYGVLAHELMTGNSPWSSADETSVITKDIVNDYYPVAPQGLSKSASKFITQLVCRDIPSRLGTTSDKLVKRCSFFKEVDWKRVAQLEAPPAFVPASCNVNKDDQASALKAYQRLMKTYPLKSPSNGSLSNSEQDLVGEFTIGLETATSQHFS